MMRWTKLLVITTAVLWAVFDIWAYIEPAEGDTISEVTLGAATKWPALAWAFGALAGHFFWPVKKERPKWIRFTGLGTLLAAFGGLLALSDSLRHIPLPAMLCGGALCGALIWPQVSPTTESKNPPR